jgi:hypothetical protein
VFEQLYNKTKDLAKSVQSVFPESSSLIIDALAILAKENEQQSA